MMYWYRMKKIFILKPLSFLAVFLEDAARYCKKKLPMRVNTLYFRQIKPKFTIWLLFR